jgi:hypothetical protein
MWGATPVGPLAAPEDLQQACRSSGDCGPARLTLALAGCLPSAAGSPANAAAASVAGAHAPCARTPAAGCTPSAAQQLLCGLPGAELPAARRLPASSAGAAAAVAPARGSAEAKAAAPAGAPAASASSAAAGAAAAAAPGSACRRFLPSPNDAATLSRLPPPSCAPAAAAAAAAPLSAMPSTASPALMESRSSASAAGLSGGRCGRSRSRCATRLAARLCCCLHASSSRPPAQCAARRGLVTSSSGCCCCGSCNGGVREEAGRGGAGRPAGAQPKGRVGGGARAEGGGLLRAPGCRAPRAAWRASWLYSAATATSATTHWPR